MKKIILFIFMVAAINVTAQNKKTSKTVATSTIKGTVTYSGKSGSPTLPDTGALVLIHKSNVVEESEQDSITSFEKVILLKELYRMTKDEYYVESLKKINAETPEKFKILDKATTGYYLNVKRDTSTISTTVDGAGNFSVQLAPGRYEVIIKSKGLINESSMFEVTGCIENFFIEVKAGEIKIKDYNFKP